MSAVKCGALRSISSTLLCVLQLLCACVGVAFVGCTPKDRELMFDTDLFHCMYNEEKTEVTILELTEKGAQQEILVIPETVNGLPVVQLGGDTKGYPYNVPHWLKSDSIKKIYVDGGVIIGNSSMDMKELAEIVVYPFSDETTLRVSVGDNNVKVYIMKGIIGTDYFERHGIHSSYEDYYYEANVTFYSEPDVIHYVDNYSYDGLYVLPQDPTKDGYVFAGWCEEDGTQWDKTYPLSKSLSLYAKWEKGDKE